MTSIYTFYAQLNQVQYTLSIVAPTRSRHLKKHIWSGILPRIYLQHFLRLLSFQIHGIHFVEIVTKCLM